MKHWLMKSEPDVFSLARLKSLGSSLWDGVRNYQARNFMMNEMKIGDRVLFYHSSCEPPGVAGLARVTGLAEADPTQFNAKSEYFDPKATRDKPIWYCVRVEFAAEFPHFVSLSELRAEKSLKDMLVLKKGQRLSIQPVTAAEFAKVVSLGGVK